MEGVSKLDMDQIENEHCNEKWIRIGENQIPEGKYLVTSLVDNDAGVKIALDNEVYMVEVLFDGAVEFLCDSREGIRMKTWEAAQTKYNDRYFFKNWFFYKIEESQLLKWLNNESYNLYENNGLIHYCIVTSMEIVDIVAHFEPSITVSKLVFPSK